MRISLSIAVPAFILTLGLLAIGLSAAFVYWYLPAQVLEDAERDTRLVGILQSGDINYHLARGHLDHVHTSMEHLQADHSLVAALLVDERGEVLLATSEALSGRPLAATPYAELAAHIETTAQASEERVWSRQSDRAVYALFPITFDPASEVTPSRRGVLLLHRDASASLAERFEFSSGVLATLAALIALVSLAMWLFTRTVVLKRVNHLIHNLDQVGKPEFFAPGTSEHIDEVSRIEAALADASARIQEANRQLADSEARFRGIFDSAFQFIGLLRTDGTLIEVNRALLQFRGIAKQDVIGKPLWEAPWWADEQDVTRLKRAVDRAAAGEFIRYESELHAPGDHRAYIDFSLTAVESDTGDTSFLIFEGRDITERKHAEHELRIAAAAFDVQEGIIVANSENVIERVNHAFTRITGYEAREVIGKTPAALQSGYHDAAFYEQMWAQIEAQGYWEGEIWNRRKDGEVYPEWLAISAVRDAAGRVTHYVGSFVDITEDKEAEKRIHQLAFYDPLTDLANRRLLLDRLGKAMAIGSRNGCYGALLMLDFDHFKMLNDTRGHAAGDALLIEAARRLKLGVRESDSVARIGGDEFVVILEGLDADEDTAAAEAVRRAYHLQLTLAEPYYLADVDDYRISVSVGIALFKGRELFVDDLMKQADVALYEAKSEGRNTLRFFNPERQKVIEARARLEEDLRRAIQNHEFQLHYQPQVDNQGRIIGAEALLRWTPPDRFPVSPAEFIPIAEETGQILPVSNWVLTAALEQVRAWQENPATRHLYLAINISAKHFHQPGFTDEIKGILESTGADPAKLYLELTENVGMEPTERVLTQFHALKKMKIRFAIDDFGTGYSSLSYIQRLPVDQIKIDQSFVNALPDDATSAAVVRAILAMSHAFGLNVVAEGVETAPQRAFLEAEGCDAYQGFYFSKALPIAEFENLLRDNQDN